VQNDKIAGDIKNTKTNKHIGIPGTRLYLVPPPQFKISSTFIGLQADSSVINIFDLVGDNFYTNARTFGRAEFENRGVRVFDYQEVKVNGYPAKYALIEGENQTRSISFVFGDTTFSTMIMATYPANNTVTEKQVITCLNSIYYDKQKKIDPFETAHFSLNTTNSKFKFYQYNSNLYLYSVGGIDHEDTKSPIIVVTQMPFDGTMTTKDIADAMMAKGQQYGLTDLETKSISTDKVNGYDAYEMEIEGQMQGKDCALYLCVTARENHAIVFEGVAKDSLRRNVQAFKDLSHTIEINSR
jgi:hypothetical protein